MRFIGSKERLIPHIKKSISKYVGDSCEVAGDLFSGTSAVSRLFKKHGYKVVANDNLKMCNVIAKATLLINKEPEFPKLFESGEIKTIDKSKLFSSNYDTVLDNLNVLKGEKGFIYSEYSPGGTHKSDFQRLYFTDENAQKIDAIKNKIFKWKKGELVTDSEYCLLLSDLMRATNRVANIAGTYGCFNKIWDKRAFKHLTLIRADITPSRKKHEIYCVDANELAKKMNFDLLYLDPPYTWRHYGAYYHILETIAENDHPEVTGKTGLRAWQNSRSRYCDRKDAVNALSELVSVVKAKHIFLSYNCEGLISHEQIMEILSTRGEPHFEEIDFRRYRSNKGGSLSNLVKERLYHAKIS